MTWWEWVLLIAGIAIVGGVLGAMVMLGYMGSKMWGNF